MTDLNVKRYDNIISPFELKKQFPYNDSFVENTRNSIREILNRKSNKIIIIVGPCSIHDINSAKEYAIKLKKLSLKYNDKILILMRVYFEKPRTTVGWKGLINDPNLNETYDINKGLMMARELLLFINNLRLGTACEFLDTIIPQYISDLVSWGAIGARTTESQIHRELVSGLSMPIGFKNGTSGDIYIAKDAILSASSPHSFIGINEQGTPSIVLTKGNKDTHIILRGGNNGPNYKKDNISSVTEILSSNNLSPNIMVDVSHGNSGKNYKNQQIVAYDVIEQMKSNPNIIGMMIESNLVKGKQKLGNNISKLVYGQSITDCCIDLTTTEFILEKLFKITENMSHT